MSNPEAGPRPEDIGAITPPPAPEAAPPITPHEAPVAPGQPRRNWIFNILHRNQHHETTDRIASEEHEARIEARTLELENQRADAIIHPERFDPRDPDHLADLMEQMSWAEWRQQQIDRRYDGNRFRAFLAGEYDYRVDKDSGIAKKRPGIEIARRAVRAFFNKQVGITAATGAATGIPMALLTGGTSIPATLATIFGTAVGRGVGEVIQSGAGQENSINKEIAKLDYRRYKDIIAEASAYHAEGVEPGQKAELAEKLINGSVGVNDEEVVLLKDRLGDNVKFDNLKTWLGFGGGLAGLALSAHSLMNMDIDGKEGAHHVSKHLGDWVFAFRDATEKAGDVIPGVGKIGGHLLSQGDATMQVLWGALKNAAPSIAAVLMGAWGTHKLDKNALEKRTQKFEENIAARRRSAYSEMEHLRQRIPEAEAAAQVTPETPDQIAEDRYARLHGQEMVPHADEIWVIEMGQNRLPIRIVNVDWENGNIECEPLNQNLHSIRDENQEQMIMSLDEFADAAIETREGMVNNWLVDNNDEVQIDNDIVLNRQQIPAGRYRVTRREGADQVTLSQPGHQVIQAPIFGLALFNIQRFEPERQQENRHNIPLPAKNDRYHIIGDVNILPENLRNLPELFIVQEVDERRGRVEIYDEANPQTGRTIPIDVWRQQLGSIIEPQGQLRNSGGQQRGRGGENRQEGAGREQ